MKNITITINHGCTLDSLNAKETDKRIPTIVFLIIFMIIGILGNLLVIVVYFGTLKRRESAHWTFIRALAIVDFLVCTIVISFELAQQTHQLTFYNEGACKLFRTFTVYSTIISAFLMIVISSDRLRLICWPSSQQLTSNKALIVVAMVAIFSIVFAWPEGALSGISLEHTDCNLTGYDCSFSDRDVDYTTPYSAILFSVFIICMLALIIMYSIMVYQVFRRGQRARTKTTKIAFVISLCFIVSYIPFSVVKLNGAITRGKGNSLPEEFYPILARMFIINNIVNPFVYFILDSIFREHCLLLCKSVKNRIRKRYYTNAEAIIINMLPLDEGVRVD